MAKDIFHQAVRIALEKDGWKITDDRILLARKETDRILYLAVSKAVYERRFKTEGIQLICQEATIRIVVFNQDESTIVLWTS